MIRYIITSTIFSLLFLIQLTAQTTTISGEIKNPNVYSVIFQWENDLISGIVKESVVALNGANEFSSQLEIKEPTIIHIKYGSKSKNVFLEPGDDLKVNFDANQFDYSFSYTGKGSENNKLLDYFGKEYGKYSDNFFIYEMAHKSHEQYRSYMDGVHKEMWNFYQKNSFSGISYHFRNYLKSEIDYIWAYNLLRYRFENPKANLRPGPIVLPRTYYSFLDEVQVQNPNGLRNKSYHKFVDEYLNYRKDSGSEGLKKFTVIVESNSLTLREEPKTGSKLGTIEKGTVLEYLKDRSKITSKVYTRGKEQFTKWIKVKTPNGQIGWIIEAGVDFVKSSDSTDLGTMAKSSKYNNAGKHLKGEVLECYIAKELHKSVRNSSLSYDENDFQIFLNTAKNPVFKSCVQNDYSIKFGSGLTSAPIVKQTPNNPIQNNTASSQFPSSKPQAKLNAPPKRVVPRGTNYVTGIAKNTELKGDVKNATEKEVKVVFYKDRFSFEETSFTLPINARNQFNLIFDISEPTTAKIIYGNAEVEFFIEPGDNLEMSFDGKIFPRGITFGGECGEQNNFLALFNKEFSQYDENYVYREIAGNKSSNYRFMMDKIRRKKWNFLHQYDMELQRGFSTAFTKYITAEIDYWWANNLLRYHWEHPAANGLPYPMKMTPNYYNFLGKVLISNDNAIASKSYLSFLTLYLKLREDTKDGNITNQIRQGVFRNLNNKEEVMNSPGGNSSVTFLFSNENVKYLNVKSPTQSNKLVNGRMKTDYWYQVSTNDGYIGWVFGGAGSLKGVEDNTISANKRFKTIEEEKEVTTTVALVKVDRLRVRKEPDLPSAVGLANEGEELVYLGRKSSQRYTFTLRGLSYNDHFYKIQTTSGQEGWVFGGGIELQTRKTMQKTYRQEPIVEKAKTAKSGGTEMYLTGRALYYTKANDIYWKCKNDSKPEDIKKEVDRFISSNPYKEYDVAIQSAYDDALRRAYYEPSDEEIKRRAEQERLAKVKADSIEKVRLDKIAANNLAKAKKDADRLEKQRLAKEQIEKDKEARRIMQEAVIVQKEKARKEREAKAIADKEKRDAKIAEANRLAAAAKAEAEKLATIEAQEAAAKAADEAAKVAAAAEQQRIEEEAAEAVLLAQEKKDEEARIAEENKIKKAEEKAAKILAAQQAKENREKLAADKREAKKADKQAKLAAAQKAKDEKAKLEKEKEDARLATLEDARIKKEQEEIAAKQKERDDELAKAKREKEAADTALAIEQAKQKNKTSSVPIAKTADPAGIPADPREKPVTNPTPIRVTEGKLSRLTECVLDGMAVGLTPTDAEAQCKAFFEEKAKEVVIEIPEGPNVPAPERGTQSDWQILESIDITPINTPKSEVQFSGKITNHKNKMVQVILYPDPVSMKEVNYNLFIKGDGTFSTILRVSEPTIGKFVYGSRLVELYIEPNDKLAVDFDAADFFNSIKFNGPGGGHNNFLKKLSTQFTNGDKEVQGKMFSERNASAFKKFIEKVYKEKQAFYNINVNEFSSDFAQYAKASIDYWYAYKMTSYRWENPLNLNQPSPKTIREKSFYNFMDDIPVNNENALPNEFYAYYLDIYLDDKSTEPENKGLTKLELATKYFTGEVKYFYQAKRLTSSARNGQLAKVIFDVKLFMNACPYQPYKEHMKSALRESNTILPGMQAPDFTLTDYNGKVVSLSDLKGKVIYLDFWATWCTSCMRQIANTTEMRRKFQGKDVVFVYVSADNTEWEWKNYVKKHNITGIHLFEEGGLGSKVAHDYGVKQLPAIFIIDKEGKIVKSNTMKQSSQYSLTEQLNQLLLSKYIEK